MTEAPKKRGPKPNPNKLRFRTVGLSPDDWEYLKQWQSPNDDETNFTPAMAEIVSFLRVFAPGGPEIQKPRDAQGRFLPGDGTSRNAETRRRRRLARQQEEGEENGQADSDS